MCDPRYAICGAVLRTQLQCTLETLPLPQLSTPTRSQNLSLKNVDLSSRNLHTTEILWSRYLTREVDLSTVKDQAAGFRMLAAETRSAAEHASSEDRAALLRSARGFEWAADAVEYAEDASPAFCGCHPADAVRR